MTALEHLNKIFGSADPTITLNNTNFGTRKSLTTAPECIKTPRKKKLVSRSSRTKKLPDSLKSSKKNVPEVLTSLKKTKKTKKSSGGYADSLKKKVLRKRITEHDNALNPQLVDSPYPTKDSNEKNPSELTPYQNILNFFWGNSTKTVTDKKPKALKPLRNSHVTRVNNEEEFSTNKNKMLNKSKSINLQLSNAVKKRKNLYTTILGERSLPLKLLKVKITRRVSFQSVYLSFNIFKTSIIEQTIQLKLFEEKREYENNQKLLKEYMDDYKQKLFGVLLKK
jgi:hypothetical protein